MEGKKLILYISLILFSISILIFGVWREYYKFLQLKKTISELEKSSQYYKDYFSKIEETFSKVKEKEEEVAKIKSALPLDPQIPETFNFLQKSISETGLLLKKASFSIENPENTRLGNLKIQLSLFGKYDDLKSFLKKVENSSRLIEIENISFSGKEPFDIDLSLKAFFIKK